MTYDSTNDTLEHIELVGAYLDEAAQILRNRGAVHDASKLQPPEKEGFDQAAKLKNIVYGSEEYKASLKDLQLVLDHHYAVNSHHPQHYPNGINGMDLFDLVEMFFDWLAATKRGENGDIKKSIEINKDRFQMDTQLVDIFSNTVSNLQNYRLNK
jgi:hypothetical protein